MSKTGLFRPGAIQMVASTILIVVAAIGPIVLAAMRPSHEWLMVLSGLPAIALTITGGFVVLLYFVGFLSYCASKGYSKWLGFWLFFGTIPGFIVLLMLPDLKANINDRLQTPSRTPLSALHQQMYTEDDWHAAIVRPNRPPVVDAQKIMDY